MDNGRCLSPFRAGAIRAVWCAIMAGAGLVGMPAVRAQTPALPPPAQPAGTVGNRLEITLGQAVLMVLTNNRALRVQCRAPDIQRTFETEERAVFDPLLSGNVGFERDYTSTNRALQDRTETLGGSLAVAQPFATGTRLEARLNSTREEPGKRAATYTDEAEISLTQALLQGRSRAVNLVRLQQARLETAVSEYELRGYTEKLVAETESTYWECALARRKVAIVEKSLALAEQQLREVEQRIKVGNLPETELAAAQAEVALRREARINARSTLAANDLRLLRLVAPDQLPGPRVELFPVTDPRAPQIDLGPAESHVALALRLRPDVNQAFLKIQSGDLELVRTRNGLLPKLDLFVALGDTGYARSFDRAQADLDGEALNLTAGLNFEWPVRNRQAEAGHRRAQLTREQLAEALRNLEDGVRIDVETGLIEVERTREQVAATETTRRLQEEKLRAESVKFSVGRSTALLVAQAQRDLLSSQVAEVDTVVRHLQALVDLFRLEGSLLERRGIEAPGRQPPR